MERGQILARVFLFLFALPFLLSGLGISGFGLFKLGTGALAMVQHGQTDGTVVDTSVESATGETGGTVYYPVIEYTYTVDGESYTSERIYPPDERESDATPGKEFPTREAAEEVLTNYGGRPTVYYPKSDPGKGFLESPTDNPLFGLIMLLFGLPFLGGGGLVMYIGLAAGEDDDEDGGGGEGEVPPDIDERLEGEAGLGDDSWGSGGGDDGWESGSDDEWGSDFGGDGGGGFGGDGGGGE